MARKGFFGRVADFLGSIIPRRSTPARAPETKPPAPREQPPRREPPPPATREQSQPRGERQPIFDAERDRRFAPESAEIEEKIKGGTAERPLDRFGNEELIWILDTPSDTGNYDPSDVRKPHATQASAINDAKDIPVPTIIIKDEDGYWRVIVDYVVPA